MLLRLKEYIDSKGISISKFEKSIGMSNASFGKSLKSGGTIGADKLEIILNHYPDINLEWLVTGNGEMLKSTSEIPPGLNKSSECEKCKANERLINALQETIESQRKLICRLEEDLEEQKKPDEIGQKRKAG
jgi:hypothetical protein